MIVSIADPDNVTVEVDVTNVPIGEVVILDDLIYNVLNNNCYFY